MSQTPRPLNVNMAMLVVPDGVRQENGKHLLRLSVSVTPSVDAVRSGRGVDLIGWPRAIAGRRFFRVAIGRIGGRTDDQRTIENPVFLDGTFSPDLSEEWAVKATDLWTTIFDPLRKGDEGFQSLHAALTKRGTDAPRIDAPEQKPQLYGNYATADLGRVIESLYAAATANTLIERAAVVAGCEEEEITSAAFPPRAWWRSIQSDWFARNPLDGEVTSEVRLNVQRGMALAGATVNANREYIAAVLNGASDTAGVNGDSCGGADGGNVLAAVAELGAMGEEAALRTASVHHSLVACSEAIRLCAPNAEFWRGAMSPALADAGRALRDEIARFEECWGFDQEPTSGTPRVDPHEDAGRKFAAILSHPTLSKFLGFVVDLDVDVTNVLGRLDATKDGRYFGAVAVDTVDAATPSDFQWKPDPEPLNYCWTSFVVRAPDRSKPEYFGPCTRQQSRLKKVKDSDAIKDGLLDLTVLLSGAPRFKLISTDVSAAVISLRQQAIEINRRNTLEERAKDPKETITVKEHGRLPELRSRGITLIDCGREAEELSQTAFDAGRTTRERQTVRIRDAEDLIRGYRIDVGLTTSKGGLPNEKRWRSLMCRDVSYGDRHVPAKFQDVIKGVRYRDDGVVQTTSGRTERSAKDTEVCYQEVFSWMGENLGVQALRTATQAACSDDDPEERKVYPDELRDLAIDVDVDLPKPIDGAEDRLSPPLRHRRGYLFGARLALLNGCGLTLPSAVRSYTTATAPVLGADPRTPYLYRRIEEVQAPQVLLPWDDRIVTSQTKRARDGNASVLLDAPGETIDTLVVRTGARQTTGLARRFVVPPRSTFDLSEQNGSFDEASPQGAFTGDVKVRMERTGDFPIATGPKTDTTAERGQRSRGSYLMLDSTATRPDEPFHPDPLARCMRARFAREDRAVSDFGRLGDPVPFWQPKQGPNDAAPIVLELKPATAKNPSGTFAVDEAGIRPVKGSLSRRLSRLTVFLGPAETVDLDLWSVPDAQLMPETAAVSAAIRTLSSLAPDILKLRQDELRMEGKTEQHFKELLALLQSSDPAKQAKAIDALLAEDAVPLVNTKRTVRLVHAVDRPRAAPTFEIDEKPADVHPVVITIAPKKDSALPEDSWDDYVAAHLKQPSVRTWESVAGGMTTFLVGKVCVDRLSTGRLRCEASWQDYGPNSLRRVDPKASTENDKRRWVWAESTQFALFPAIEQIDAGRTEPIDLLRDETGNLRRISHSFPDGRARRLTLSLIATSRFSDFYVYLDAELNPKADDDSSLPSPFDRSSKEIKKDQEVWVPATVRPAPPVVDRILPQFHFSSKYDAHGRETEFTREVSARVYLRAPWHSSGEGEKLAVLFWEDSVDNSAKNDCDLDKEIFGYRDLVSRWGADPIHLSGSPVRLLQPSQFSDPDESDACRIAKEPKPEVCLERRSALKLLTPPPPESADKAQAAADAKAIQLLDVSIVAYTPRLTNPDLEDDWSDDDTGPWACSIKIDAKEVYFPFIQLGLARYQKHAVSGLELSTPVRAWFQVPPVRKGTITYHENRRIVLELRGIGFHNEGLNEGRALPRLNVTLMTATRQDRMARAGEGMRDARTPADPTRVEAWRKTIEQGRLIAQHDLLPSVSTVGEGKAPECWWHVEVTMPAQRNGVRYGLLIEEFERMMQDQMKVGQPGERHTFEESVVPRSPMFSHIVDLGE